MKGLVKQTLLIMRGMEKLDIDEIRAPLGISKELTKINLSYLVDFYFIETDETREQFKLSSAYRRFVDVNNRSPNFRFLGEN